MDYSGVIIDESLEDKSVLQEVVIKETKIELVDKTDATPWLDHWTMHIVIVPEQAADQIAEKISKSLDREHGGSWYADFRNDQVHYVIFRGKIFKVVLGGPDVYREVVAYGLALGIPLHQLEF